MSKNKTNTLELTKSLVGKEKRVVITLCKRNGLAPNTTREDKTLFMSKTMSPVDYNRVNLEFDDGFVTNAWLG